MSKQGKYRRVFNTLYCFRGFKISGVEQCEGLVLVLLKRSKKRPVCPRCGRSCKKVEGEYVRSVRDLDMGGLSCYVQFSEFKLFCRCGYRGYERLDWVREYSHCTRRFEERVAMLCDHMSVKEVSGVTGLGWRTVKTVDKNCIREGLKDVREYDPVMIGVDEVAYEKGHKYLTVVRDVLKGVVIWVGIGRKELTLDLFYASLGREKTRNIRAVVMDMWDPYIASTRKWTDAEIVFDKFHLAKKANECLDTIRRKEFKKADPIERREWKNKRFIILSREKNLPDEKKETLSRMLESNQPLYKAYLLKEQLLDIMDETIADTAISRLETWKQNVQESMIKEYQSLVKTVDHYLYGIQNYFKHRITNAGSEGFNNKINLVKRRAYGFRDIEYFMLKILKICGGKPSP